MILDIMMNIVLVFMLLSLFNLVRYMFKIRKVMKMHKDNPNIKGFTIVNGEIKPIEGKASEAFPPIVGMERTTEEEVKKDLVVDPACGKEIEKKDAYRILKNGKEYFFCCWECRETFLESLKKEPQTLV